mmetsp:Transcript_31536/g.90832  ORF Transcript_31536/g.90832 Transcript_31536/m.90832 type:complete len:233 (-) Transcript_31536:44-742(-)
MARRMSMKASADKQNFSAIATATRTKPSKVMPKRRSGSVSMASASFAISGPRRRNIALASTLSARPMLPKSISSKSCRNNAATFVISVVKSESMSSSAPIRARSASTSSRRFLARDGCEEATSEYPWGDSSSPLSGASGGASDPAGLLFDEAVLRDGGSSCPAPAPLAPTPAPCNSTLLKLRSMRASVAAEYRGCMGCGAGAGRCTGRLSDEVKAERGNGVKSVSKDGARRC